MTPRDQNVFSKAADKFQAWILVRQTNSKSLQYKGKSLYAPKPISCKPKTADRLLLRADKQVEGLVVNPFRWPEAFSAGKLADAGKYWTEFRMKYGLGEYVATSSGFIFFGNRSSHFDFAINIEPKSPHEGCLTQSGKYLFGDFDLFDIVFLRQIVSPGSQPNLKPVGPSYAKGFTADGTSFKSYDHRDDDWDPIAAFINQQLGVDMIQHGSQFLYKANEFETVDAFGPGNTLEAWSASVVQMKYKQWGRI